MFVLLVLAFVHGFLEATHGAAVRGFKKAVNEGDDEQTRQLNNLTGKDADFQERSGSDKSDSKPGA